MAEAVSSAIRWLGHLLLDEVSFLIHVQDDVQKIQQQLEHIQQYLHHDDAREDMEKDRGPAIFTKRIRKIAYEAEDILDEYIHNVATSNDEAEKKTRKEVMLCGCLNLIKSHARSATKIPLLHDVGSQVRYLLKEIDDALHDVEKFKLVHSAESSSSSNQIQHLQFQYPHAVTEYLVGMNEVIQTWVKKVTDAESKYWVVGIVGGGGTGKTTAAREIYNHKKVKRHFNFTGWVCISRKWNKKDVLWHICRQTGSTSSIDKTSTTDDELVYILYEFLRTKGPYCIVLDDMWHEEAWEAINQAFPRHQKGSKIIVTTRYKEIPLYVDGECEFHEPRLLTSEESWDLFSKIVAPRVNKNNVDEFELGKGMVSKCKGLPLAVVTLGGLLRKKRRVSEWEYISRQCHKYILKGDQHGSGSSTIDSIVAMSYVDLPCYLKPCFLSFSLSKKGESLDSQIWIEWWIAEGFITRNEFEAAPAGQTLVNTGLQYLEELSQRCLIEAVHRSYNGQVEWFRVHDIVHDFCIQKAQQVDFIVSSSEESSGRRARNIYPKDCAHLRSFECNLLDRSWSDRSEALMELEEKVVRGLDNASRNFKLLRIIRLEGITFKNGILPAAIGDLIQLRYLSIKDCAVEEIPASIGNLRKLLTLHIINRFNTSSPEKGLRLPNVIKRMNTLTDLSLPALDASFNKTWELHTVKSLQALIISPPSDWFIKEYAELVAVGSNLHKVRVDGIKTKELLEKILHGVFQVNNNLHHLGLEWALNSENAPEISGLSHYLTGLQDMVLEGEIGEKLTPQFPANLRRLQLRNSCLRSQDSLAVIGQLAHLKVLLLYRNSYQGTQWYCSVDAFPQLEHVALYNLPYLQEWMIEEGAMPLLKEMEIYSCDELRRLPDRLETMTTLQHLIIERMPPAFCERLNRAKEEVNDETTEEEVEEEGEDYHIIQNIRTVEFKSIPWGETRIDWCY